MTEQEPKHISETIERAVEGALRFAGRFVRTFWVLLATPHRAERLLEDDAKSLQYTRPYTFLAVGGFFFTLIFSAFPHGLPGLIDIIWFSDEVTATLRDRSKEVLTISGILLAGIPVLLTVPALSAFYGAVALAKEHRLAFSKLAAFAFGYQTLAIFSLFYVGLGAEVSRRLFPVASFSDEPNVTWLLVVISALTVTAISNPIISLWHFQRKLIAVKSSRAYLVHAAAVTAFVLITFSAITYTASLPGAARVAFASAPATVSITIINDPQVLILESPDGSAKAEITLTFVVDNARDESLIVTRSGVDVLLRLNVDGEDREDVSTDVKALMQGEEAIDAILLPRHQIEYYAAIAAIDLDAGVVESLKLDNTISGNQYSWSLVIHLREWTESYERAIRIADHYVSWTSKSNSSQK